MTEESSKHYNRNDTDYDEKMGTNEHAMMHYGNHSEIKRNSVEQVLRKLGFASKDEIEEAVVHRIDSSIENLEIEEDDVFIDSGSGRGGNTLHISDQTDATVIGLDLERGHVKEGRQRAKSNDLSDNTEFVQGTFDDLPVENFDVYFAVESQCHSLNEEELFEQVYEGMNPGGQLFISDGFRTKRLSTEEEDRMDLTNKGWGVEYLAHIEDVQNYLEDAGFENIEIDEIEDEITPTAEYLHKLSTASIPYLEGRLSLHPHDNKLPFLPERSEEELQQVRDLATTGRHQYLTMKDGLWTQFDVYAEKPE